MIGYARCTDPVQREPWPDAQLELSEVLDPEWPGEPPRPDGAGWIWVVSVGDVFRRFGIDRYNFRHLEVVAAARGDMWPVHERLHDYGPRVLLGMWVASGRYSRGTELGIDIEARGGAWVRAFEPDPWWVEENSWWTEGGESEQSGGDVTP